MRLTDRYLLREFAVPLLYCLLTFSLLFVIVELFENLEDFSKAEVGFGLIFKYYGAFLSSGFEFIAPVSLLLATLYSMQQMTKSNELIAMRASGISLQRIVTPLIISGAIFAAGTLVMKEFVAPAAMHWAKEFKRDVRKGNGDQHTKRKKVKGDWKDPVVYKSHEYYNSPGRRLWTVIKFSKQYPDAMRGALVTQEGENRLRSISWRGVLAEYLDGEWWFYGLRIQKYNENGDPISDLRFPKTRPIRMPHLDELPSDMTLILKDPEDLTSRELIRYMHLQSDTSTQEHWIRQTNLHTRLAGSMVCIIAILLGVPCGARSGRQGMMSGIIMAIAGFFLLNVLVHLCIAAGKTGVITPWVAAWMPIAIFGAIGGFLMLRIR